MPNLEPHKLSTKLCRLFDAGYSDVRTFARECELPPHFIEAVCNRPALRVDRESERQIGKVLSGYLRQHPDLYRVIDAAAEPKRGVLEDESPREDERVFTLKRRTNGKWFCTIRLPADEVDDELVQWLWRVLKRKERRHLEAI